MVYFLIGFGVPYLLLSFAVPYRYHSFHRNHVVGLGGMAMTAWRLRRIPGLVRAIPKDPWSCRVFGICLFLIGLTPLMVPFSDSVSTKALKWFSESEGNSVGYIYLIALVILGCIMSAGWSLLFLPTKCKASGWSFPAWVDRSQRLPTLWSLFSKDLPEVDGAGKLRLMNALAAGMMVLGILFFTPFIFGGLVGALIGSGMIIGSTGIRRRVMRSMMNGATPDKVRKPVLYLRAFKDDAALSAHTNSGLGMSAVTLEEVIILACMAEGRPVVALGKPGENLPPAGAERYYVTDDDWQEVISQWILDSQSIVMVSATTKATEWETGRIFELGAHERCLFLFVNRPDQELSVEQTVFERLVAAGMPPVEWRQLIAKNLHLIGIAFDVQKYPILLVAERREKFEIVEALKWHGARLVKPGSEEG